MPVRPDPPASPVVLGPQFHPCRLGPVVRHVGEFLAGDDATEAEQRHAAAHPFRNAQVDFEQFTRSVCEGHDLVAMELSIRGGGRSLHSVSTHLPSPLTLLLLCTRNCDAGDLVAVRQQTATCGSMTQEAHWPFGLPGAERLTRPASVTLAALQRTGPESVRRRERAWGDGHLVTERRRERDGARIPRVRRWREPGLRGIELRIGARALRIGRTRAPVGG